MKVRTRRGIILLHVKLPPPFFFFIENDSPFILALLGERHSKKGFIPPQRETHAYRVRVCCASLYAPRIDFKTLWNMPIGFTIRLYEAIMAHIAPDGVVRLMRGFLYEKQTRYTEKPVA